MSIDIVERVCEVRHCLAFPSIHCKFVCVSYLSHFPAWYIGQWIYHVYLIARKKIHTKIHFQLSQGRTSNTLSMGIVINFNNKNTCALLLKRMRQHVCICSIFEMSKPHNTCNVLDAVSTLVADDIQKKTHLSIRRLSAHTCRPDIIDPYRHTCLVYRLILCGLLHPPRRITKIRNISRLYAHVLSNNKENKVGSYLLRYNGLLVKSAHAGKHIYILNVTVWLKIHVIYI